MPAANFPEIPPQQRDAFYQAVWNVARKIPYGKVATYGQIGALTQCPMGVKPEDYEAFRARWVGNAIAAAPQDVPWQRVINSQGKISPRPGAEMQRKLLEQEGVTFDSKDRVDLKKYGWSG